MASYPSAVKTFTAKNAGDTIQPSHIGDLQDEVTAIEDGLLNGTAPINSSRITAPALSISGNSTLTGSVTCSSLVSAPNQPRASAYNSGTQSLANGAFQAVTFNTQDFNVGGLHSTTTTPTRFTVPAGSSGLYLLTAQVYFPANSSGHREITFLRNGATQIGGTAIADTPSATYGVVLTSSLPTVLDATQYVEVAAYQDTGAAMTIGSSASVTLVNRMTVTKLW